MSLSADMGRISALLGLSFILNKLRDTRLCFDFLLFSRPKGKTAQQMLFEVFFTPPSLPGSAGDPPATSERRLDSGVQKKITCE